jgi:hypothetical protein
MVSADIPPLLKWSLLRLIWSLWVALRFTMPWALLFDHRSLDDRPMVQVNSASVISRKSVSQLEFESQSLNVSACPL